MPAARITECFDKARAESRAALIAYLMVGDPDLETSYAAAEALIENGADILELGAPFTDPMADGPAIQAAGQRALMAGARLDDVLSVARRLRANHPSTPLILMGYANPIHHRGYEAFASAAADAGVDGTIVVDLPPEEDAPLRAAYAPHGLAVIRMAAPTTLNGRMDAVAAGASGFIYYVSITGVTGGRRASPADIAPGVALARKASGLPVAVGFGIRTPDQAAEIARIADGVVVGTAFVEHAASAKEQNDASIAVEGMGRLAAELSAALRSPAARRDTAQEA